MSELKNVGQVQSPVCKQVIVETEVNAHRLITTTYATKESVEKDTQRYVSIISETERKMCVYAQKIR